MEYETNLLYTAVSSHDSVHLGTRLSLDIDKATQERSGHETVFLLDQKSSIIGLDPRSLTRDSFLPRLNDRPWVI